MKEKEQQQPEQFASPRQRRLFGGGNVDDLMSGLSRAFTLASGSHFVQPEKDMLDGATATFNDGKGNEYKVVVTKVEA